MSKKLFKRLFGVVSALLLVIALTGCPGTTTTTSTTSTTGGQTEASVPETPPPSDIAALKNPLGVTAANIAAGKALYERSCWICHGLEGEGNGPAASHLPQKPIDFTSDADFQTMNDGEVWWIIKKGVEGTAMPNWETAYTDDQIWQLESYVIQFRTDAANRPGRGTAGTTTSSEGEPTTESS